MKTLLEKTLFAMTKLFDFSPRERSRARKRLDEIKKLYDSEHDYQALKSDYEAIGNDLRTAMKKYDRLFM